jgi:hypothetical protein
MKIALAAGTIIMVSVTVTAAPLAEPVYLICAGKEKLRVYDRPGKPSLFTAIATSSETLRTSPAQLRLSTMPSRYTYGCSPSIGRFRHPSIAP